MKIKNIRSYRTFYKEEERKSNNNEHFIGNVRYKESEDKEFGWFSIYHGDKDGYGEPVDGVRNFLKSFLDMARDGQAVYEFLQNAVDANAHHFTMVWGYDELDQNHYALVANNGKMFDYDSIRSVLNVGSSTKVENPSTKEYSIGKFGIGFKLAHRLVGKDNGLDELVSDDPSGPILFSWNDGEIFDLIDDIELEPQKISYKKEGPHYKITDSYPWFFKILITCFPVLPENPFVKDNVLMLKGSQESEQLFSQTEIDVMRRWIKKHKDIFNQNNYKQGSLFFMKLGENKQDDLADKNLEMGTRFSLAVLQETSENNYRKLNTIQLNDHAIQKPELNYLSYNIANDPTSKDFSDYVYVRYGVNSTTDLSEQQLKDLEKEGDIEVLFGFRSFPKIGNYFEGAPNLYLYFPLSEEVHNFNFILHSNAFYKASSRTFLHQGSDQSDGINERLFKTIVKRLEPEMLAMYERGEYEKYLDLYAAILTSGESDNQLRNWVKKPFINPLNELLKHLAPIKTQTMGEKPFEIARGRSCYIKNTGVEFDLERTDFEELNWFFWEGEDDQFKNAASRKMELQEFSIVSLLEDPSGVDIINEWISGSNHNLTTVLDELVRIDLSDTSKKKIKNLKVFLFPDDEHLSATNLLEKQNEGYIVKFKGLAEVKDLFQKAGLILTDLDYDESGFIDKMQSYLGDNENQLRAPSRIVQIFSNCSDKLVVSDFNKEEKLKIFRVFRDFSDEDRLSRLAPLQLFNNKLGKCMPLDNLLRESGFDWLKTFEISENEYSDELRTYLTSKEDDFYHHVIYPCWEDVGNYINSLSTEEKEKALDEIVQLYEKRSQKYEESENLTDSGFLFFRGGFEKQELLYVADRLNSLTNEEHESIQSILFDHLSIAIPDKACLSYYLKEPFKINEPANLLNFRELTFTRYQIKPFLKFYSIAEKDLFQNCVIVKKDESFVIDNDTDKKCYSTVHASVDNYINKYHEEEFLRLPEELSDYKRAFEYTGPRLFEYLIERLDPDDAKQAAFFATLIKEADLGILKKYVNTVNKIHLDKNWTDGNPNKVFLNIGNRLFDSDDNGVFEQFRNKLVLSGGEIDFGLSRIDSAEDEIDIKRKDQTYKLSRAHILGDEIETAIQDIITFYDKAVETTKLPGVALEAMLKISRKGVTEELLERFRENLHENKLKNEDQLLLVLLSEKISNNEKLDFKVESAGGSWYNLSGNWMSLSSEDVLLYNEDCTLAPSRYPNISEKLGLGTLEAFSYIDDSSLIGECGNPVITSGFIWDKGMYQHILNNDADDDKLLNHLFKRWKLYKNEYHGKLSQDWKWDEIFSFNPDEKVYCKLNIEPEKLDSSIIEWIKSEKDLLHEKLRFLRSLGVRTKNSRVCELRRFLIYGNPLPKEFKLSDISIIDLQNTLIGLAESYSPKKEYELNSGEYDLIKKMIRTCVENDGEDLDFRVPIYSNVEAVVIASELDGYPVCLNPDEFALLREQKTVEEQNNLFKNVPIIPVELVDIVGDIYSEIELDWLFKAMDQEEEAKEPDERLYNKWSNESDIKLHIVSKLKYRVSLKYNEKEFDLGLLTRGDCEYEEIEGSTYLYRTKELSDSGLVNNLREVGEDNLADHIEEYLEKRNKLISGILTNLSEEEQDKTLSKIIDKKERENERKEYIQEIKDEKEYSYKWFKTYLNLLSTYDEKTDPIQRYKKISFSSIKKYYSEGEVFDKFLLLESCNTIMPLNIDSYTDFKVTIDFNNRQKEQIEVEGVSRRGQDLLAYMPSGVPNRIKESLEDAISVSIEFLPVLDLIDRLNKSFETIDEWDDISEDAPPLTFIYGPPGTGKTTTVCKRILDAYNENPTVKVLVLVPTNKAGDVLAKKLISEDVLIEVARLGSATDPELDKMDETIYRGPVNEDELADLNVIITTIHRLPYFQISEAENEFLLFKKFNFWDYLVFDEASMISLSFAAFALMSVGRNSSKTKILVSGDPKQIPPILDIDDKDLEELGFVDQTIYKMFGVDSFNPEVQKLDMRDTDNIQNLIYQYRSVETVGTLYSEYAYEGILKHARDMENFPAKHLPADFIDELKKPISLISVPISKDDSVLDPTKKLIRSSYHLYSGLLTLEILRDFDKKNNEQSYSIGVVSPYKAQATMMSKLIAASGVSSNLMITCDTVHGLQGDEFDVVVFIINPNNMYYTGHEKSHLSKEYIYNVAISRARDYLWLLHPYGKIKDNEHVNRLSKISGSSVVNASDIEKKLFGKEDFIVENSYLMGHDSVNVFGSQEMKYFLKVSESAMDIQIREG